MGSPLHRTFLPHDEPDAAPALDRDTLRVDIPHGENLAGTFERLRAAAEAVEDR